MVDMDPTHSQDDGPTGDREDSDDLTAPPDDSGRGYDDTDFDSDGAEGEPPNSEEDGRSEHDKWRRWAWAALVVLVIGVAWALTLSTILLNRSGDNTAELISLFEESQERREAALRQSSQSEEARRAALDTTIAESRTFRAQAQAARASQAERNASARRALAQGALAGARTNQANTEAALAQARADRASREAPSPSGVQRSLDRTLDLQRTSTDLDLQRTLERNIDLLRTLERNVDLQRTLDRNRELQRRLNETIRELREVIRDLRSRP